MKFIQVIISTIALVAATATPVYARDSVSIGVNIGGYGHGYATHSIGTHRHAPAFYGYYGAPTIYYSAQPVIYYAPPIHYNHYQPYTYYGRDVRRYDDRHHNRHHSRHGDNRHGDDHRGRR